MADDQLLYAVRDGRQIGRFSRDKLDTLLSLGQLKPSAEWAPKAGISAGLRAAWKQIRLSVRA